MEKSEPSSLVDDARNQTGRQYAYKVEELAATMSDPFRAEFVDAINHPKVPPTGLSRALRKRGIMLSEAAIKNFRRAGKVLV
jgi:hypothetical protein